MDWIDQFESCNGPPIDCRQVPAEVIERYQSAFPSRLIQLWREAGWCGYRGGLIWIINPEEYAVPLKTWFARGPAPIAFARTAFCDLFLWNGSNVLLLDPVTGHLEPTGPKVELFLGHALCDPDYLEDVCGSADFEPVVKRLGRPSFDECFGFMPPPGLGGADELENLKRLKADVYLSICGQAMR